MRNLVQEYNGKFLGKRRDGRTMNSTKMLRILSMAIAVSILAGGCQINPRRRIPEPWSSLDPGVDFCSQGIVPGRTSLDEAEKILTDLGYTVSRCPVGLCLVWAGSKTSPGSDFARGANRVVAARAWEPVTFVSVGLEAALSLEQMFDRYGAPEKYLAYETSFTMVRRGKGPLGEGVSVLLALYYPGQGLIFVAWVPAAKETADINPRTLLTWVACFPPTSLDRLAEDVPEMQGMFRWEGPLRDWEGTDSIYVMPYDPR